MPQPDPALSAAPRELTRALCLALAFAFARAFSLTSTFNAYRAFAFKFKGQEPMHIEPSLTVGSIKAPDQPGRPLSGVAFTD